ncbi:Peptidase family M48 [Ruegeria halocynthiae]|uniref:Peptidase family M48 n=2 Tax=Ruegeria halocynthiae TaxID=985054 RepID=A0A1H3EGY1_9RHOB|nr:M48 family metalloprotease [Ruegeria halocynthiae]SDX77468.1 Peptidase family M48 [Ruegeria halocynthiae]
MRRVLPALVILMLSGCISTTTPPSAPIPQPTRASAPINPQQAQARFRQVAARIEPVAERECRRRTQGVNCDFLIRIDPDKNAPSNAYQSLDKTGRPVLTMTQALIRDVNNTDELAFVLAHEAAHHVQGHLARQAQNAAAGAVLLGSLATLAGTGPNDIATAQDIGAFVGGRSYSKNFELEADKLGTIIAHNAGYDPLKGALYFTRVPDPGDRFLGTHPPNAQRYYVVQATMAEIGG